MVTQPSSFLPRGFDPAEIRLIGEARGEAPYKGTFRHHGWRVVDAKLPTLAEGVDRTVIAPAEVEGAFAEGLGFDGSAIEGLTRSYESDLLAHPDPSTFQTLPWRGEIDPTTETLVRVHAPLSIIAAKTVINEYVRDEGKRNQAAADKAVAACFASQDYIEGRRAFMEKRKPVWQGK